jgi:hypothetical protein
VLKGNTWQVGSRQHQAIALRDASLTRFVSDSQLVILVCVDVISQELVGILKEGVAQLNGSATHE